MDEGRTLREDLQLFRRLMRILRVLKYYDSTDQSLIATLDQPQQTQDTVHQSNQDPQSLQRHGYLSETRRVVPIPRGRSDDYGGIFAELEEDEESDEGEEDEDELYDADAMDDYDDESDESDDDTDLDEDNIWDDRDEQKLMHNTDDESDQEEQDEEDDDDDDEYSDAEDESAIDFSVTCEEVDQPYELFNQPLPLESLHNISSLQPLLADAAPPAPPNNFISPQSSKRPAEDNNDLRCWKHGCNGRRFTTRSNFTRHVREKSKERPECRCPRCGAVFSRTTARNTHLARESCNRIRRYSNGRVRPGKMPTGLLQ